MLFVETLLMLLLLISVGVGIYLHRLSEKFEHGMTYLIKLCHDDKNYILRHIESINNRLNDLENKTNT